MVAEQDRAAGEAAELVEVPGFFGRVEGGDGGGFVEGVVVVEASVEGEELPGLVGAAQAEIAGGLADLFEQAVIAVAAAIGVVVAAQGEERRFGQDGAQGGEEVGGAFLGGAGVVDVAEMDDGVRALAGEEGGDGAGGSGAGAPVGEEGDAHRGAGGGEDEVGKSGVADVGDGLGAAIPSEVAGVGEEGFGPERVAAGEGEAVVQGGLAGGVAGGGGLEQLEAEPGAVGGGEGGEGRGRVGAGGVGAGAVMAAGAGGDEVGGGLQLSSGRRRPARRSGRGGPGRRRRIGGWRGAGCARWGRGRACRSPYPARQPWFSLS